MSEMETTNATKKSDRDSPEQIRLRDFCSWLAARFRDQPLWLPLELTRAAFRAGYDWQFWATAPVVTRDMGLTIVRRPHPWFEGQTVAWYTLRPSDAIDNPDKHHQDLT